MKSRGLLFWSVCVACFAVELSSVRAQETANDLLPHQAMDTVLHEPIRYSVSGKTSRSWNPDDSYVNVLEWITDDHFAAALKLTKQQKDDLKDAYIHLNMEWKQGEGADNSRFIPRESKEFDQVFPEFLFKMQELLTNEQVDKLERLSWKRLLKRNAIVLLLFRPEVQRRFGVEFEMTDGLKEVLSDQINEVTKTCDRLRQKAIDVFHEGLNEKQSELLDRDWKRYLEAYQISALDHFLRFDANKFLTTEDLAEIRGVDARYTVDGDCEYWNVEWTEKAREQFAMSYNQWRELENLVNDKALLKLLDLSEGQAAEIVEITNRFDDESNATRKRFAEEYDIPFDVDRGRNRNGYLFEIVMLNWRQFEGDEESAQADSERRHKVLAEKFAKELAGVLVPSQQEMIEQLKTQRIIRQLGPIADLKHGDLKHWVKLSPEEFEAYDQRCKEVAEELRRETRAAFEKSFDAIIEALPKDVRKEIQSRMSEEQSDGFVDLGTWLMLLKRGQTGSDVRMPENPR